MSELQTTQIEPAAGAPANAPAAMTRKTFLAATLAASSAAVLAAGGVAFADGEEQPQDQADQAEAGKQKGFFIETDKCVDCGTCAHKCNRANKTPEDQAPRRKIVEASDSHGKTIFASVSCMHCLDPSCMAVCPAGAISKREQDGAVVVDHGRCIGCKYCYEACPFSVPKYNDQGMYKCDFCIENGTYPENEPACVQGCPHDALHFGVIEDFIAQHGNDIVPLTGITGPSVLLSR